MAVVSCHRQVLALWANHEESNAWAFVSDGGWRKLDDRSADACTNLLRVAVQAKRSNATVRVREELRGDRWYITEMYDLPRQAAPAAQDVSFAVSECRFRWTAAFQQQGTIIRARIRLEPEADVTDELLTTVKARWKRGIEDKWSYRFACCADGGCASPCALVFVVEWVTDNPHLTVTVKKGGGRSNLGLWHTDDSGDVASHEFGHLMGHPDEYSEPDVCPNRSPVNTGTVMDDNSEVVERLCRPFCSRIGHTTTSAGT